MTNLGRIVIVGAGQAGFCCAKELRAKDFQGTITLIGNEPYPPYDRPPLSKAVLLGKATVESTFYFTTAQLESAGITFFPSSPALSIDRSRKRVLCPEQQELPYDHLVIATGAQVRRLPIPGSEDADILYLRDIDDCLQLKRRIMPGCRVLVIGAGLIGLEVAAAATTLGASATVIEAAERVMARVVGKEVSRHFEELHRRNGVEILTGLLPTAVRQSAGGWLVEIADSRGVEADLVVAGIGITPNDEIAARAGLKTGNGIWTDEFCRTEDPSICAIGDVANQLAASVGYRLRLETWQNARSQGMHVARNLCGKVKPYFENPWGWSDQFGSSLQILGLPSSAAPGIVRDNPEEESFSVFYLRDNLIEGMVAVNAVRDIVAGRRLMAERAPVNPDQLRNPALPLKTLIPSGGPKAGGDSSQMSA